MISNKMLFHTAWQLQRQSILCKLKTHSLLTSLQRRHNGCNSISNHQPHDYLLNRLFRRRSRKHQSSASLAFVWGIHRKLVNSPHQWPVTLKTFPFDDIITFRGKLLGVCCLCCVEVGHVIMETNCAYHCVSFIHCHILRLKAEIVFGVEKQIYGVIFCLQAKL